jgi:hypothetical protein
MPDQAPALSEDRRRQLDGIVSQMESNQESPDNIQFVVDDFKKKYSGQTTTDQSRIGPPVSVGRQLLNAAIETGPQNVFTKENLPILAASVAGAATAGAGAIPVIAASGLAGGAGEATRQAISGEEPQAGKVAWEGVKNAGLAAFGEGISKALSVGIPGLDVNSPQVKAWLQRAQDLGIPIDAAVATGNPVVGAAKFAADRTLPGAKVAGNAEVAAAEGARDAIGKIANRRYPVPQTAETAGAGLRQTVSDQVVSQGRVANASYDALRKIEESTPSMVVDYTDLKRVLQPIRDRMQRQIPSTLQANSPGVLAMNQILAGPDKVPLSIADADRSVLLQMAREADPNVRSFGQGVAAKTAALMDVEIQKAAQQGGPNALNALLEGRAATKAKYAANEVLGSFAEEPVKAFNQATLRDDTGIDRLRSLQKVAPGALPKLGRGYLDDLVADATIAGDRFSGDKALTNWNNLGPETKKLLFPDAGTRADLDAIFQTMKRMSANPNPSGTAHTLLMYGELGTLMASPLGGLPTMATAAGVQLTGGVVSKLLRSAAGIRALRDGLTLPLRHPQASAALQTILRTAQSVEQMPARSFAPALAAQDDSTTPTVGAGPR